MKLISNSRLVLIILIPFILTVVCILKLYDLQVVNGAAAFSQSKNNIVTRESIPASRGSIYDRYGRLLVGNRVSYNIAVNREKLVTADDPNGLILKMIRYADELGVTYIDESPLERTEPFGLLDEMTDRQLTRLRAYCKKMELDPENKKQDLFSWWKEHYSIPETYTPEEARDAVGIRYELELRSLLGYAQYYFAEDVNADLIVKLTEQDFPGVSLATVSVREYHTSYAAHILGRVGQMDAEEYEVYKEEGYPLNALVGKDGLEAAFESELHGTDGVRDVTRNPNGTITEVLYSTEPKPGNNVRLTIDIDCQQVVETALAATIQQINETRAADRAEGKEDVPAEDAQGGAAVVMDVRNFDLLASASYPTFDLANFSRDYPELRTDPLSPLFNRAIQAAYEPGSTFKMVTALGALNEHIISGATVIHDDVRFTQYDSYQPVCWSYPYSHGNVNVVEALTVSCNYFFYDIGVRLGIDKISKYAKIYGFGEKTGIELSDYENPGNVATREYKKEKFGEDWLPGNTLQAAIGQSYNVFTPVQLAVYCATVANGGTRYSLHYLKDVETHDNTALVRSYEPIVYELPENIEKAIFRLLQEGMRGVASKGTARTVFETYPVKVAAKTGTVQFGEGVTNNAIFIAYAPYDNPEIAVAIAIEKGGSGSECAVIAKEIFDYYFAKQIETSYVQEGVLIK